MTAPLGLAGAALVLWGVSIRLPWLGLGAAVALEGLRLAPRASSVRMAALVPAVIRGCALLALASLGYVVATQALPHSLYNWLRWLPIILLPVPALQLVAGRVAASSLRRSLRRDVAESGHDPDVDVTHAYAALTLAAAGTGSGAQPWLYAGFAIIVSWALLARLRPPRRAAAGILLALACGAGYAAQLGISALQAQVEEWSTEFLADLMAGKPDPFRERTRIGDLGKIKLSDRIVMRVTADGPRPEALLLRESAFDRYHGGEWQGARRTARRASRDGDRWTLAEGNAARGLSLRRSLPGGEGLLPLPLGTRFVDNLPALSVEVFPAGTVRARGTPRYVSLRAGYDEGAERDAPDASADLAVPDVLSGALLRVLDEERLRRPGAAATVDAVKAFFDAKFSYSLDLGSARDGAGRRTLADFLLRERKGHCEYFATATVLLLRQAGIPARYVGGYSAQEYSALEKAFVVRARHAHAWAMAYVDGRWVNVDTTPARWAEFEGEAARGFFAPLLDRASWLVDRLLLAWLDFEAGGLVTVAGALFALILAPALLLLARHLRARVPRRVAVADPVAAAWAGVEDRLARAGHPRAPGETARAWAARLHRDPSAQPWARELVELARAYYRARFDPAAGPERPREFILAARAWKIAP